MPGGGGGVGRGPKKVSLPKIDLQFRAPLISVMFFLRKIFLMWVGGSGRRAQAAIPIPPPARGNGKPWPERNPNVMPIWKTSSLPDGHRFHHCLILQGAKVHC